MFARYVLALTLLLTSCVVPTEPTMSTTQRMPDNSSGVRAGCIRTLARLALDSRTAQYWSPDDAAKYCDEIERSFQLELKRDYSHL